MNQVSLLNLYQGLQPGKPARNRPSPGSVYLSIFRRVLKREGQGAGDLKAPGSCADTPKGKTRKQGYGSSGSMGILPGEAAAALGKVLVIPEGGEKTVLRHLAALGMPEEEAQSLLRKATDSKGNIHLDRLEVALQGRGLKVRERESGYHVPREGVPELESLFFQMGMGAEDVKGLEERCLDGKGNFRLAPLAQELGASLPGLGEEKGLSLLLGRFGIRCVRTQGEVNLDQGQLRSMMDQYLSLRDSKGEQGARRQLALVLREKGLAPEEVRSFLDRLTVRYARSVLASGEKGEPQEVSKTRDALLERVVLKGDQGRKEQGARARVMDMTLKKTTAEQGHDGAKSPGGAAIDGKESAVSQGEKMRFVEERVLRAPKAAAKSGSRTEGRERTGKTALQGLRTTQAHHPAGDPRAPSVSGGGDPAASETPVARPAPYVQVLPDVAEKMRWMLMARHHTSRLELSPPELGRLDLEVAMDKGVLRAHIGAENLAVKQVIESNLGQLREQLSQLGIVVEKFEVMVGLASRDFGGRPQGWQDKQNGKAFRVRGREDATEALGAGETAWKGRPTGLHLLSVQV